MTFQSFQELLPEIAENETRSITILQNASGLPPAGQYMFIELFCTELDCDCRNVMIVVFHVEKELQVTRLRYCWETKSYYDKIGLAFREDVPGVFVDFGYSSPYSKYFVKAFEEMCYGNAHSKSETEYAKRLKRHYQQFREQLKNNQRDVDEAAEQMIPQPYSPCTCASGKKFKFCCKPIFHCVVEAMCAAEDGLHEEALQWISKAEKIVGNTAEVLCRKAIIYSFTDRQRYVEYLQKCLEVNPQHPRAHYLKGIDSNKKGDYEAAIAAYLKAIQYYPSTDHYHLNEVYNNLANVYHQIGEHTKAIAAWKTALEYSSTDKMARMNLQKFGTSI
ncbi:MAG: tetratricopeptide repeat protein [Chlamydiia bacterium]|nr:tetratricopeptide repeat protein [Chlamydiia bacterium]